MGLFSRKPLYNDIKITAGKDGSLFAHFTSAVKGKDYTLPPHLIQDYLQTQSLHADDRALFVLALDRMKVVAENLHHAAEYEVHAAERAAREKRIANLLANDAYDLRAPDRIFRRHLVTEPARLYKGYALLTGDAADIRAALKLKTPTMSHSIDGRFFTPRFTVDMAEHRLLYEHRNNGHLNYDDQLLVYEALREMRNYKIKNGIDIIPLHPAPAPKHPPFRGARRGFII